jgi:hypothetical protein
MDEITLSAEQQPISVSVRHNAFKVAGGGGSTEDQFVAGTSDQNTVAGRFYRKSRGEFGGLTFTYDATVTAPIWREPAPTMSGAVASNSPQAKAALAFLKAGRSGNVTAIKKTVVAEAQADLDGPMGKEIVGMMKMGPDPTKGKVVSVNVDGESAEVRIEQGTRESSETTTIKLKLEHGQWKVSPR